MIYSEFKKAFLNIVYSKIFIEKLYIINEMVENRI